MTRLRLVHDGEAYHLFVKDKVLTIKAATRNESFRRLAFWLDGEEEGSQLLSLAIHPHAKDLPCQTAKPLIEDFRNVPAGTLPQGWIGDSSIGVRSDGNAKPCLTSSEGGTHFVSTAPLVFPKNFEVAIHFAGEKLGLLHGLEISLEGQGNSPDVVVRISGNGISLTGAAEHDMQIELDRQKSGPGPVVIAVRRSGPAYMLLVNGRTMVAHRLPGYGDFRRITLCNNSYYEFCKIYRLSVTDLDNTGASSPLGSQEKQETERPIASLTGTWESSKGGGAEIKDDGETISFSPIGEAKSPNGSLKRTAKGKYTVRLSIIFRLDSAKVPRRIETNAVVPDPDNPMKIIVSYPQCPAFNKAGRVIATGLFSETLTRRETNGRARSTE